MPQPITIIDTPTLKVSITPTPGKSALLVGDGRDAEGLSNFRACLAGDLRIEWKVGDVTYAADLPADGAQVTIGHASTGVVLERHDSLTAASLGGSLGASLFATLDGLQLLGVDLATEDACYAF